MEVVRQVGNWQKDRGENHPGNGEEGTKYHWNLRVCLGGGF